jgi:predicted NAD/FAD-binding protein
MKKIAIIGSGIAGTSSAYYLNKLGYDITLFEAGEYFGGHTNTIDIDIDNTTVPVDTGFLVHNNRTYPNLIDFFQELEIETTKSEMTFSVTRVSENIIWAGTNLLTVFVQPKNLFSFRFYHFLKEVLRFNKSSKDYLNECQNSLELTLGELLKSRQYSQDFQNWYLLPMGGCIWSTPTNEMLQYPAYTFLRFCTNHGLLQIFNRPTWKSVTNGSRTYVRKALAKIEKKYLNEPVIEISKDEHSVKVTTKKRVEHFDYCILCNHPPEMLKILNCLNEKTRLALSKFKYQKNLAVLHFDNKLLPKNKSAWAAWNYHSIQTNDGSDAISVSYLINKLQNIPSEKSIIVTLNPSLKIDSKKTYKEIHYEHPVFSTEAILAQTEISNVQGEEKIYFAGAWMRYGFHEDGILSAKRAIKKLLKDDNRETEPFEVL